MREDFGKTHFEKSSFFSPPSFFTYFDQFFLIRNINENNIDEEILIAERQMTRTITTSKTGIELSHPCFLGW